MMPVSNETIIAKKIDEFEKAAKAAPDIPGKRGRSCTGERKWLKKNRYGRERTRCFI